MTNAVLFNGSIGDWFRTTVESPTGMSTVTHPLQHISGKDNDRRLRRSCAVLFNGSTGDWFQPCQCCCLLCYPGEDSTDHSIVLRILL